MSMEIISQHGEDIPEGTWIVDVFGRENIEECKIIAEKLEKFGKKISVILESENQISETYLSDFDE